MSKTSDAPCEHLEQIEHIRPPTERACVDCLATGGHWVHLRTCQTCGLTRCCDSSPGQHASRHARETGHPVVASAEPGERWLWCYPDEIAASY